jgi:hexosaminidase
MKKTLLHIILILLQFETFCQVQIPHFNDSLFSTYYHQRVSLFRSLPKTKNDIIFLGNSITDGGEWAEIFQDLHIKNRGISGDNTIGVLHRIGEITDRNPDKVFILIGVNDLKSGLKPDSVVKNIIRICSIIKAKSPKTKLYVQSILPVNEAFGKFGSHTNKKEEILEVNKQLSINSNSIPYTYIDIFTPFCDATGRLNSRFTNDGLHLTGEGYLKWKDQIQSQIYDLPALIPLPQKVNWGVNKFLISNYSNISFADKTLRKEAELIKTLFKDKGSRSTFKFNAPEEAFKVELRKEVISNANNSNEAYSINVTEKNILIKATSAHGFFNAIQTLSQLINNNEIQACEITDWPAFSWRGYMVDVGRNYQSIKQLKQQIDVMAAYKLNIFHCHLTEDIAWRLQSKAYPQLTNEKYMLRDKGKFYTLIEIKELIKYCKDRHITFIPEIDMPGHSDAFKRAMGVEMQSEQGLKICKNILIELCHELDVPYIHIGGDEVKISYKEFLPEIVALIKTNVKKVIGWDPGGNVPEGTFLQMWNGKTVTKEKFPSIDSRHLYLNHFDPIDGVVTTFNHQICDVSVGDTNRLGAILCNWPDRKVAKEEDIINMNAVYPVMLSFAERCWQGGGWQNFLSDIGKPGNERYNAFLEFENRLLQHKSIYFKTLPFPYIHQSNIEWKLIGPYDNNGKTDMVFAPETPSFFDTLQLKKYPSVYGGTIWFRHFWHPMIPSHLGYEKDSTTFYATRNIWSDKAGSKDFWISFNNISRSPATDSPPEGAWDNKNSVVWVNGKKIEPPHWKNGGQKGDSEIPLIDEGYEYREPTKIFLQKGWNTILIKAPVGSFIGSDWQNPVKWMFTFIQN